MVKLKKALYYCCGLLLLSSVGCSNVNSNVIKDGAPKNLLANANNIKEPTPKIEPRSKYGNPPSYVVFGKRYHVLNTADNYKERGLASWYGTKFHGRRTSSGEPYNMYELTAAHKSLPLPTYVRVKNIDNGKSIVVKVNDRGPFHGNRIIDLSYAAAVKLGIYKNGTGRVEVSSIKPNTITAPVSDSDALLATNDSIYKQQPLFVQVGAFSSQANAEVIANRVQQLTGKPVTVSQISSAARDLFKVHVGPLTTEEMAEEISQLIIEQNISPSAFVVADAS